MRTKYKNPSISNTKKDERTSSLLAEFRDFESLSTDSYVNAYNYTQKNTILCYFALPFAAAFEPKRNETKQKH